MVNHKTNTMKPTKTGTVKIRKIAFAFSLAVLCSLQGCMYYYKVQAVSPVGQPEIKTFTTFDKYLILHQREKAWHLSQPMISGTTLYGKLSALPENRYKFQTTKPKGGNKYIKKSESYILEEVHLYVSDSLVPQKPDTGSFQIAFSQIQHAEVYIKAQGRTTASWLIPGIGGPVLAGCAVAAIIGASLSNWHINLSH